MCPQLLVHSNVAGKFSDAGVVAGVEVATIPVPPRGGRYAPLARYFFVKSCVTNLSVNVRALLCSTLIF